MCSVGRMSDRICTDFTLEKKKQQNKDGAFSIPDNRSQ